MLKIVVIDDEINAVEYLEFLLRSIPNLPMEIKNANSVLEGIKVINQFKPELVFLDIQMPHGSGFDLLEVFEKDDFKTVFTTAYEKYALHAIKKNAFDYLLKPIEESDLIGVLDKYLKQKNEAQAKQTDQRIAIPYRNGFVYLLPDEIDYLEADGSYSIVHATSEKYTLSKKLKAMEEVLEKSNFCRIHASYLVNLSKILRFSKTNGGEVILKNGTQLSVSDAKRNSLLARLPK